MGNIEARNKHRKQKENIKNAILGTVAAAGVLSVALVAPNALRMFNLFGGIPTLGANQRGRIKRSLYNLIRQDLLSFETRNGKKFLRLTLKGERKLALLALADYKIKKPKRWDGKFRIIIFDIKESNRTTRDIWRIYLQRFGFMRLQHSVWVYPYDCEDIILMLKTELKVGKDILYMIVDEIEYDKPILEYFKLERR